MKETLIKTQKHLTLDERIEIQECLNHGMTFFAIGKRIGKHETTVSREVKRHMVVKKTTVVKRDKDGNRVNTICKQLLKAPFVCNPCKRFRCVCSFDKHIYCAKTANKAYGTLLVSAREGIPLNTEKFYQNDSIIKNGLDNGQHLYQIMQTNNLGVSKSTVYDHAKKGYLSALKVDFPRIVKFKKRKGKPQMAIPSALKSGRTYEDFLQFKDTSEPFNLVEMDTVWGRHGGKAVLRLDFVFCNFMLGFLLNDLTSACVAAKIREIKLTLQNAGLSFVLFFPVILTDYGSEFADIFSIENDLNGKHETKLFFCDPHKPSQKPHVEKNNSSFRDIAPKGTSFDDWTQETVNTVFSHVNSTARKALGGKTSYEVFAFTFSKALPILFDLDFIQPDKVIQSPLLLKNLNK
jgi:IS30 family transposase